MACESGYWLSRHVMTVVAVAFGAVMLVGCGRVGFAADHKPLAMQPDGGSSDESRIETNWEVTESAAFAGGAVGAMEEGRCSRESCPWWNERYRSRVPIFFRNEGSEEGFTGFPVRVHIPKRNLQSWCDDEPLSHMRFVSPEGSVLPVEVDSEGMDSVHLWVRVPRIRARSNTDFAFLYCDYQEGESVIPSRAASAVWAPEFRGVWHMERSERGIAGGLGVLDSTSGARFAHFDGESRFAGGAIGNAAVFDRDRNHVAIRNFAWSDLNGWTASFWLFVEDTDDRIGVLSRGDDELRVEVLEEGGVAVTVGRDSLVTPRDSIQEFEWTWVTLRGVGQPLAGPVVVSLFLDGEMMGEMPLSAGSGIGADESLATVLGGHDKIEGALDELRVQSVGRSNAWIGAQYLSMVNRFTRWGVPDRL